MKKIVLLLAILLLTGCLGETGKGYIIKTCSKDELVNFYKIYFNEDFIQICTLSENLIK